MSTPAPIERPVENSIDGIAARVQRSNAKQAEQRESAYALERRLAEKLGDLGFAGASSRVTLAQIGADEFAYGYLRYEDGGLSVGYRLSEDDVADEYHRVPPEARSFSLKPLPDCPPEWLEPLLDQRTLQSLLNDIALKVDEREKRLDASLTAIRAILHSESAKLDGQMVESLDAKGNDTLGRLWDEAVNATHSDTADGLTRSCRFVEAVCAAILRERGEPLPSDLSLAPLVKSCIKCLQWPSQEVREDVRQFTGGLTSLCNGIGSLRTHSGTAHGASSHLPSLDASYAMLAKNAAAAVSIFLLEHHMSSRAGTASGCLT